MLLFPAFADPGLLMLLLQLQRLWMIFAAVVNALVAECVTFAAVVVTTASAAVVEVVLDSAVMFILMVRL